MVILPSLSASWISKLFDTVHRWSNKICLHSNSTESALFIRVALAPHCTTQFLTSGDVSPFKWHVFPFERDLILSIKTHIHQSFQHITKLWLLIFCHHSIVRWHVEMLLHSNDKFFYSNLINLDLILAIRFLAPASSCQMVLRSVQIRSPSIRTRLSVPPKFF